MAWLAAVMLTASAPGLGRRGPKAGGGSTKAAAGTTNGRGRQHRQAHSLQAHRPPLPLAPDPSGATPSGC